METLAEFDKEIIYKLGKENVIADALSRPPQEEEEEVNNLLQITSDLTKENKDAYLIDEAARVLVEYIKNPTPELALALQTKAKQYTLQDDLLYFKERLFVPTNYGLSLRILQEYHNAPSAEYLGVDKIYKALTRNF